MSLLDFVMVSLLHDYVEELEKNNVKKKQKVLPKIVISSDGKETKCEMIKDGKVVKQSIAKCNPEDKFSLHTGASIALDRLFNK